MPSYTYECVKCGTRRDEILSLVQHGRTTFTHCHKPMRQVIGAPQIMRDIDPYRTVAADKATGKRVNIGSRREHREFLRRNGYVEIGNEIPKAPKRELKLCTKADIKTAIEQVKAGKGAGTAKPGINIFGAK